MTTSQILESKLPEHLAARQSAKRRESGTQIVALLLAVACFIGAGAFLGPLNRTRKENQLVIDSDSIKGLPPHIALLGKLGTFRALVIDWASIRAERLKQEGKTYEALQLHQMVCALAPRFPTVWINAAWNMAYNISVSQYSPEARWKWVRNGIELLRDKGIQYNPRAVALYKELTWIYWHKIGDFLDDEHLNYKRALAVEMETILGAPPLAMSDQAYLDWFQLIIDAPRDLEPFIANDPDVSRLMFKLDEVSLGADESLLAFVARYHRPELQVSDLLREKRQEDPLTARRLELLSEETFAEPLQRLLAAVRSQVLRKRFKFDLDWMWDLMVNQYGPLDWRNAFSHGLYWASMGERMSEGHENLTKHDRINNTRLILMALQKLILKGRVTLWPDFDDPFSSYIEMMPDSRYIPFLFDLFMSRGEEFFSDHPRFREGTPGPIFMNGFVTAMHDWIELLYLEGGQKNLDRAENYFVWLRRNNPHPNGRTQEQYLQTLDQFVMSGLIGQLNTYKAAGQVIRSFILHALKQLSLGQIEPGTVSLVRARQSYEIWQSDTKIDINERRMLQPFPIMVRDEIENYMRHRSIIALYKASLWKHLPLRQRQMVYDHALPFLVRLCEIQDPPWEIKAAFPEPPGMEAFRREELKLRGKPRRDDLDQGKRFKG